MDKLEQIEARLNALEQAFIQAQKNNIPVTQKADSTVALSQEIKDITPYKETKKAYIDDTEVIFTEVPQGNMTVFCPVNYTVEWTENTVTVSFEPLTEVADITIMIQ